jgi:hypothetical protein
MDVGSRRTIRRRVGVLGGLAALAASWIVFGGISGAGGATGDPVIVGKTTDATDVTVVRNSCGTAFLLPNYGFATCANNGILGAGRALGVSGGASNDGGTGVLGEGTYGVHGYSNDGWGVWGEGRDRGVYGISATEGVVGFSNNVGIRAESPNIALRVKGKAEFSRSGTVIIAGTSTTPIARVMVPGVALSAKSQVLVTVQRNVPGIWVRAAVPDVGAGSITIYLNKATSTNVPVAWMVIERP